MKNIKSSRRNMMKRSAAFILPTLVTFQISSLKVQASGSFTPQGDNNPGKHGNHNPGKYGNRYGNKKGK